MANPYVWESGVCGCGELRCAGPRAADWGRVPVAGQTTAV